MKRLKKRFSAVMLLLAGVLSLVIGISLPRIHSLSDNIIAEAFPISYRVEFRNTNTMPVVAQVRFSAESAIMSSGASRKAIPLTDAVFVCLDATLRMQNMLRSGLLSALFIILLAIVPFSLCLAVLSPRRRRRHTVVAHTHIRTTAKRYEMRSARFPIPDVA